MGPGGAQAKQQQPQQQAPKPLYAIVKCVQGKETSYKLVAAKSDRKKTTETQDGKETIVKTFPFNEQGKDQAEKYLARMEKLRHDSDKPEVKPTETKPAEAQPGEEEKADAR